VDALDLFLEVQVLFPQASLLLLGENALGNVHDHGSRVFSIALRPGIPLRPDRPAVVPAPQFNHDAAGARPSTNRRKGFANAALILGRVRHQ